MFLAVPIERRWLMVYLTKFLMLSQFYMIIPVPKSFKHYGDTELFETVAGVLQSNTLAPYLCKRARIEYVFRKTISEHEETLGKHSVKR